MNELHTLITRVGFAVACLPLVAHAQLQQVHTFPIQSPTLGSAPWTTTIAVPQHDPALGHLGSVRFQLDSIVQGSMGVENTGNSPTNVLTIVGGLLEIDGPSVHLGVTPSYGELYPMSLPAFDGVLDHGGASGITVAYASTGDGQPNDSEQTGWPYGAAPYRGTPGSVGTVNLTVTAREFLQAGGASPLLSVTTQTSVSATLRVTYEYSAGPGVFCSTGMFGGFGACPCGTFGGPVNGCPNSLNPQGATMTASGVSSVTNDTFSLTAAGMPNSNAVFLQGDAIADSAAPFGDGLRCIDGNLIRLGTSSISGGSASYPGSGQLPVSIRGQVQAPATLYYQTYYRNAAAFCTSATFNVTSGVYVLWTP